MTAPSRPVAKYGLWRRTVKARLRLMRQRDKGAAPADAPRAECNVCGYHGAFVLKHGLVQCPVCKSSNRHRLILWYLDTFAPEVFSADFRMLHFAPELSLGDLFGRVKSLTYETADIAAKNVTHRLDIQQAPAVSDVYDMVMANHILEHIPNDRAAIANMFKLLKPGGVVLLTVPVRPDGGPTDEDPSLPPLERERRFGADDHVRYYGLDLADRMTEAGFQARVWSPPAGAPIAQYAMGGEVLFLGVKSVSA